MGSGGSKEKAKYAAQKNREKNKGKDVTAGFEEQDGVPEFTKAFTIRQAFPETDQKGRKRSLKLPEELSCYACGDFILDSASEEAFFFCSSKALAVCVTCYDLGHLKPWQRGKRSSQTATQNTEKSSEKEKSEEKRNEKSKKSPEKLEEENPEKMKEGKSTEKTSSENKSQANRLDRARPGALAPTSRSSLRDVAAAGALLDMDPLKAHRELSPNGRRKSNPNVASPRGRKAAESESPRQSPRRNSTGKSANASSPSPKRASESDDRKGAASPRRNEDVAVPAIPSGPWRLTIVEHGSGSINCTVSGCCRGRDITFTETYSWGTLQVTAKLAGGCIITGKFEASDGGKGTIQLEPNSALVSA
mmetsp:Transcript_105648/g.187861  ORF Transcript_105648/g.187861 Transcript_105648/m.187861 type:complete len:362 (+) Transcript_105648:63-1148(+)